MKYLVTVYREFREFGTVVIDAPDEEEAKDEANQRLTDGDDGIEWGSQDPGDQGIDGIEACK
jgi:hypothetical protein